MTIIEITACLNTFKTSEVMSYKDIAKELEMVLPYSRASIEQNISLFVEAGIIVKLGRNKYQFRQTPIYYKRIESVEIMIKSRNRRYQNKHRNVHKIY